MPQPPSSLPCSCPPEWSSACSKEEQIVQQLSSQGLTWQQLAEQRPAMTPGAAQLLCDATTALVRYDTGPGYGQKQQQWEEEPVLFQKLRAQVDKERMALLLAELRRGERRHADMAALYQHLLPLKGPGQRLPARREEAREELARLLLLRRQILRSFVYAQGPFSLAAGGAGIGEGSCYNTVNTAPLPRWR
jgi:hypothetical protein